MCVIVKNRRFYKLPLIRNQNYKILSTLFSRHLPEKNRHQIWQSFMVGSLEIFTTAFLLKAIIWTWISFKHFRVLSLKTKKNSSQKRCKSIKTCWHSKRQKKNIKKRKRKTKNEKKLNNSYIFFSLFSFRIEKYVFC